jgi:hypothetical protein
MSEGANSSGVAGSGKAVPTLTNIQVAVRCRPPSAEERRNNQPTVIACDLESKTVTLHHGPVGKKTSRTYSYDKVFGMYNTQEEVFASAVSPIIDETLEGYNCTIFAYGYAFFHLKLVQLHYLIVCFVVYIFAVKVVLERRTLWKETSHQTWMLALYQDASSPFSTV